jgi:UDP-N-acetylglucosamine 3-dehydrogenase
MIKTGIAGLGRQGMLHLMNSRCMKDVQVVAAADASKTALNRAKALGIKNLYRSYDEMFKSHADLDAVVLSMPNFLHLPCIQSALESGFNVFTEKPLANKVTECQEIVNLVQKSGRKLMIGHNCRFYEASVKMKQCLESGTLGDLEVVTTEEVINGPFAHPAVPTPVAEWWFDPAKSGGGVLLDIGYHMIDLFRFFAGNGKVLYSHLGHRLNLPIEDGAVVLLQSPSGVKGIVNVGWYERTVFPRLNFRVILHGNAGFISTEELLPKSLYKHAVKEGLKNIFRTIVGKEIRTLSYTYYYESFYRELSDFFNCIGKDREPSVTAEEGLRTIEIIQEAYDKAKLGINHG